MRIAVITARGGSKRIPRKNIIEFYGRPMIAWSIAAALESELFDQVIVSTDDEEIASISIEYGADVPFMRPVKLADDFATTGDVMAHAAHWLEARLKNVDSICCIYPTAPFLISSDLVAGYEALCSGNWSYSFSASKYEASVFRSFTQDDRGGVKMTFPELYRERSQDLPECLHDAAQFYWGKPDAWKTSQTIFAEYSIPVLIPSWRVVDIDSPEDIERAEVMAPEIYRMLSLQGGV